MRGGLFTPRKSEATMIENRYQPGAVEARIYSEWEKAGAFRAGRPERAKAKPYCVVIPPPNVTGSLHMGHALNNTLQDIICRFERMRGKDVLWQPGTDHAGIATQAVVERQLMERQESSRAMGRDTFIKRVWEWKAESGGTIISQLKRLGASCDWSRERFTMGERGDPNEQMVRAVLKAFVDLYNTEGPDGRRLIYKDKRLVNWDPKLKTAISDLEVQQVETKGKLWYIKYPIEGSDEFIVVATTRPETMLGDVAVAVYPQNERLKHLIGKHAILPLVGRRIPIIGDDYADPEKGSGAVKITPAHDFNDFEVGKRHDLTPINILTPSAEIFIEENRTFWENTFFAEEAGGADELMDMIGGYPIGEEEYVRYKVDDERLDQLRTLSGLDRFVARKKIVELLEAEGLVEKIEPTVHAVPHGDRSGAVLEPFLTDQWYVDAKTLAQPAMAAVRERKTVFVPAQWEATFFNWMENIQPWCISRQIWWGHQIPAWYGPEGGLFCELTETDAIAAAQAHYGKPVEVMSRSDAQTSWLMNSIPDKSGRSKFKGSIVPIYRDEDVLDTWFSSALWPFSTLGWPDETPELKRFYPTSALVTGFDIIFFWVARMMMMGLYFMKEVPFHDVYIHALVRDASGAKMSKSKGNVIDPLELIDEYGADALRFTLASMAAQGRDIKLSAQRVEGNRNFATKLWNAARFAEINGCARDPDFDPHHAKEVLNRWIAHETAKAGREVTAAIEAYKFNDAANTAYRFVWNVYCDWYLELIKPVLTGADSPAKAETRGAAAWALDEILKLLHPFMPFVTEELWRVTAEQGAKRHHMLALDAWPAHDGLDDAGAEAEIGWVIDLINAIRSVRVEMNIPPATLLPLVLAGVSPQSAARARHWSEFVQRLARVAGISFAEAPPQGAVQLVVRGEVAALPLKGVIDLSAESARLAKEMAKADADIARVDAKLNNANFAARAPEEVVEEEKEKREEARARKAKIAEAMDRLRGAV
jgi:valyl-tRNA synthetase